MAAGVQNGSLAFVATVDYSQLEEAIARLEGKISDFTKTANTQTKAVEDLAKKAGQAIAAYFTLDAASNFIKKMATVRGEFQQIEVALNTMLGSKEKADKLMAQVVQLAAQTPFGLQDAAQAAKQLLAYGFAADQVADSIKMVGNIAAGVSAPLNDIVYLYGTLRTQGRAYSQDIKQFTGRGIPIVAELAKQFDTTEDKVNTLVAAGKVGFPDIEKAFRSMTGSGGMFFNLMELQSKTLTGQISNLSDALDVMFNELGKSQEGLLSAGISGLTYLIQNYQSVIKIIEVLIAAYGSYKAAIILVNLFTTYQATAATAAALGMGELTLATFLYDGAAKIAAATTAFLNKTMLSNPYVALATVLAALVTALYVYSNAGEEVKTTNDILAQSNKNVANTIAAQEAAITPYVAILQNAKTTEEERIVALKKLNDISPQLVAGLNAQSLSQKELTENVNNYIESLRNKIKAESNQANVKESLDQEEKFRKQIEFVKNLQDEELKRDPKGLFGTDYSKNIAANVNTLQKSIDNTTKLLEQQKKATNELAGISVSAEADKTKAIKKSNAELIAGTNSLDDLKAVVDELKLQYSKANTTELRNSLTKDLQAADARKIILDPYGNQKKSAKEAAREVSKLASLMEKIKDLEAKGAGIIGGTEERNKKNIENDVDKLIADAKKINARPEILARIRVAGGLLIDDATKKLLQREAQNYTSANISNINTDINNVRFDPERELELKKQAIKEQLKLDLDANEAAADDSVDSKVKMIAKEAELRSKARKDAFNLDAEDERRKLDLAINNIKSQNNILNIQDNRIVKDDTSTINQKYEAQQRILERNQKAIKEQIALWKRFGAAGFGNIDDVTKQLEDLGLQMNEINEQGADLDKNHLKEIFDQLPTILSNSSSALRTFADGIRDTNKGLADTLDTLNDLIDGFGGIAQLAGAIGTNIKGGKLDAKGAGSAAGNIGGLIGTGAAIGAAFGGVGAVVGAAVGAVVGGVIAIVKGGKKVRESLEKTYQAIYSFQVNQELGEYRINQLLRDRLIMKSKETDLTLKLIKAQREALALANEQNKADQARLLTLLQGETFISSVGTKKYGGFLGLWRKTEAVNQYSSLLGMTFDQIQKLYESGQLDGKAKELFEQLKAIQQEGGDIQQQLDDLKDKANEVFTGTTSDSITDSIIDGFKNGEFAVGDFADNFEDLMRNAALNALKFQYLEGAINDFYNQFAASSESGGGLTKSEIADLQEKYNQIIQNANDQFQQLQDITGINLSENDNSNTLSGAVKGITEQQADLLAGQFGGLRITAMQQLSVMNSQLSVLNEIKRDTAFLSNIDAKLRHIQDFGVKLIP